MPPAARCLHLFFSPSVDLSEAIDIFRVGVPDIDDVDDDHIEVDDVAFLDDVFADSASGFSRSRASTSTVVPKEKPRRMADLFGEIMGPAATIKGILCQPRLSPQCRMTCRVSASHHASSRRATQCPLFSSVQHFFTNFFTLKAQVKAFTDFTNVEGWADTQARGIPCLEPPLAALLYPGAGWRPNEKTLPPDRLQRKIVGGAFYNRGWTTC